MEIHDLSGYGKHEIDIFKTSFIEDNDYIPAYVVGGSIYRMIEGKAAYSFPSLEKTHLTANTIRSIKNAFYTNLHVMKIKVNANLNIHITQGIILDNGGNILALLAMKKESFSSLSRDKFFSGRNPNAYQHYVMFYASEFLTNPSLSALHRRLQKEFIIPCFGKGIEVRMMPSSQIEKNTFARFYEIPKPKSLVALNIYFKEKLPYFLHQDIEENLDEIEEQLETRSYSSTTPKEEVSVEEVVQEIPIEEEALLYDSGATGYQGQVIIQGTGTDLSGREYYDANILNMSSISSYSDLTVATSSAFVAGSLTTQQGNVVRRRTPEPSIILIDDTED